MKFKRTAAAILAAFVAVGSMAVVAFAGEETIGNVYVKDGVEYTEYKDPATGNSGYLTVTSITSDAPAELVIPSKVEGLKVASISLQEKGDRAPNPSDYTKLTSITIPESVTSIGGLSICPNLSEIVLKGENPNYTMVDGVLYNKDVTALVAYPRAKKGKTYTIPKSVKIFDSFGQTYKSIYSLNQCKYLTEIKANGYVPENGALISADSKGNKNKLVAVAGGVLDGAYTIPDGVREIGENAFRDCVNLKSVSIPNGVVKIGLCAFMDCTSLSTVNIPATVNEIDSFALADTAIASFDLTMGAVIRDNVFGIISAGGGNGCDKLTSMTLPKNFGADYYAFAGLENLTDIYYGGSEEDWKNTCKVPCPNVKMHYNYQIPNYYVDESNGIIEVSAEFPEEVKFNAKPIDEFTNDTQFAYDLSFTNSKGEKVQPKGKVTTKVYKIIPETLREKYYQKYLYIYNFVDEEYVPVERVKPFRYYFSKGEYENGTFLTDNASVFIFSTVELTGTPETSEPTSTPTSEPVSEPTTSTPTASESTTSEPITSAIIPGDTGEVSDTISSEDRQEVLEATLKNVDSKNGIEGAKLDEQLFSDSGWTWEQVEKIEFSSDNLFSVQFSTDNGGWFKLGKEIVTREDSDEIWNTAWTLNTSAMAKDKKYAKVIAKDGIIDVNVKIYIKKGAVKPDASDKTSESISNTESGSDNANTGIALAIAPVVLAATAAVVIFKKKK